MIELLVVMAIVGSLLALVSPSIFRGITKAQSAMCAANLRNIGQAVDAMTNDSGGQYPEINNGGAYSDYPAGSGALTLGAALAPYGITPKSLECPLDRPVGSTPAYYNQTATAAPSGSSPIPSTWGSSYEWSPVVDDENVDAPLAYTPGNNNTNAGYNTIPLKSSKVRLCMDYVGWHNGKYNRLYADGHVVQN